MSKKKKVLIIILSVTSLLLILFTPIPKTHNFSEGTAISITSLTYKIVSWDMFNNSEKSYDKTEIIIFPRNYSSVNKFWNNKKDKLIKNGYGSVVTYVSIIEKQNDYIIVSTLTDEKQESVAIDSISFDKVAKNIKFSQTSIGMNLAITNINLFSENYPKNDTKIFEISPVTIETTITTGEIKNNQSDETTNKQNNSNNTQANQPENTSSIKLDIIEKPKTESDTSQETTTSQTVNSNIDLPLHKPKGFWFQSIHKYPEHYDQKSKLLMPYLVVEPENYDSNKKYPVILYFHGAGDGYPKKEDDEYEYQLRFNQRQAFQFIDGYIYCYEWLDQAIIIMPQLNNGNWWDFYPEEDGPLDAAMRIFDKVTGEFSCDENRYYVMGPSMGGYATMEVAAKYNDVFAAAMPSCAAWTCTQEEAEQLKDMPILFLHGTSDNLVYHARSEQNYELIKSKGSAKVSIKLYDGADHDLWRYTLKDDEPFEWLFSKHKK